MTALTQTITGLPRGHGYYFYITAYDSTRDGTTDQVEGAESWYSNQGFVYLNN
jgi:hypothetical protein